MTAPTDITPAGPSAPRTLAGVALLSAAMLALELTLTRLLAVQQFYHFAFLVISLALLGLGASGSLLTAWPVLERDPARWAALFGLAAAGALVTLNVVPLDTYAVAWDWRQVIYFGLTLLGAGAPFLFAGLAVGALLAADVGTLHRVYAANLIGSALGSLLTLPLLDALGGPTAVLACGAGGLAAAALLWRDAPRRAGAAVVGAFLLAIVPLVRPDSIELRLSPYKALSQTLLARDAEHTLSRWSAVARVDVVESPTIHAFPGLSQNAQLPDPPRQAGLTVDGGNLSPITDLAPDDPTAQSLAASVPSAVVEALRPDAARRVVLEPRGGWDVLMALAGGEVEQLTAVERYPLVAQVVRQPYSDYTHGLYADPRVTPVTAHGRTFARQADGPYDVVSLGLADRFHPVTSGAYSLGEDYRYTVEALSDYLSLLSSDGLLVFTRWLQKPPTESLRALATIEAALRSRGVVDPAAHIAAFRSLRTMTLVVSPSPLTAADRTAVRRFADAQGYDLVWLSDLAEDEVNQHQVLPQPSYYRAFERLLADPARFVADYDYDIRPATDDRPFFFHYFRWAQTPQILATLGQIWQPFGGSGYLVIVALLVVVTLLAGGLILGPLAIVGPQAEAGVRAAPWSVRTRAILYVGLIGLGYFFVLMPLAQQLILFLDEPVVALAVVFFAVLLFSGIGSLNAPRVPLGPALGALVLTVALTPPVLARLTPLALGWPLAARGVVAALGLAPLGLLMGVPFARGVARIEHVAPGLVAWSWAINGSASVVATVLAVMIALGRGFSTVLWLGALCYGLAFIAIRGIGAAPRSRTSR